MRVNKVRLKNIRNYSGLVEFDFTETTAVNTVSGANGSGKTTVFKSLLLCQKAYFSKFWIQREDINREIEFELSRYFNSKASYIEVEFEAVSPESGISYPTVRLLCEQHDVNAAQWDVAITKEDKKTMSRYWNIHNPTDIIVYVDSNKSFLEEDTFQSNISVINRSRNELLIDTIIHPEKIFFNIYRTLVSDYLTERLVPAKPRRDLYLTPTKIILNDLLPNLEVANFSGQHYSGQFVLLGRSSAEAKSYDVRNFSSGEKTAFYLILFLNYVRNVGTLIIDEPENHFHEDLLSRLTNFLAQLTSAKNSYAQLIISIAEKNRMQLKSTARSAILKAYSKGYLSNVFLLTHSKNLIYNNFSLGKNFNLNKTLTELKYDQAEVTLREIGISSIYTKVLFVEGDTDNEYLSKFLSPYNIKTRSLGGCSQVIATYNRIRGIKEYIRESHFCFLIDRDTKDDEEIRAIAHADTEYFSKHFIVLEAHEFENLLLEPKLLFDLYQTVKGALSSLPDLDLLSVEKIIQSYADLSKQRVLLKAIKSLNEQAISIFNKELLPKTLPIGSEEDYNSFYESLIPSLDITNTLLSKYTGNYKTVVAKYDELWVENWRKMCDGKMVFRQVLSHLSQQLGGINKSTLISELKNLIVKNSSYEVSKLVDSILQQFR